jgi:hypothetical protein
MAIDTKKLHTALTQPALAMADDGRDAQKEIDELSVALAACRDAAFSEPITSRYFDSAMADPLEVPLYVKDQIDALRKDAERMAWQPIETAPAEGKFLVYMPDEDRQPIQVARWHPKVKVIGGNFAFDMPKPTHWMPLPDAPKVDAALALRESGKP